MAERMRLDKLLAFWGLGTRSAVRELIRAGRAQVDEAVVRDPAHVLNPALQTVRVDGIPYAYSRHRHGMLHKPSGLVTAARDAALPTVMSLLPQPLRACGCMPVGRLDRDTEGLLLFTSDGGLAHRLLSPRCAIDKVYLAQVDGPLGAQDAQAFADGLTLSDFTAQPASLAILESGTDAARALCTVREGKYHQVKRMFAARGRTVTYLKRLSLGPVQLDEALPAGAFRELTDAEVAALYAAVRLTPPDARE